MSFIKNSAVLYKGPSKLNGEPIVAVATYNSANSKTGAMMQIWILSDTVTPTEAKKQGLDAAVCGVCPIKKECYVNLGQAPRAVFNAYKRDRYKDLSCDMSGIADLVSGKVVRFGAYGDIAALPFDLCRLIIKYAKGHTAYTHQRKHKNYDPRFNTIAHISAETAKEAFEVARIGLGNTFRTVSSYDDILPHEIKCPSDTPAKVNCVDCRKCNGATGQSIVIVPHGSSGKKMAAKLATHSKPAPEMLIKVVYITPEQKELF